MEQLQTDILMPNHKGRKVFIVISLVIAATLITLSLIGFSGVIVHLLGMIGFLFAAARYYLQTRKQVLKKAYGKICFSENKIDVHIHSIPLQDISAIDLNISGWKSYTRSVNRSAPVEKMHTGDKNYIILYTSGYSLKYEFYLDNREEWFLLRNHVINWYRRGIKITESGPDGKTYGLEVLNYMEIQEFKKQILNPHVL